MHFYYFMMKQYRHNYLQAKCIGSYVLILLPVLSFGIILCHTSPIIFHAILFLTGWCTWTFIEYILHRFWMHDKNSSSSMTQMHIHHHKHPTELVVTNFHRIAVVAVLALLVVIANYLDNYFTLFVGFSFGVETYFLVHRMIHLRIGQRIFKKLVRYHIYHHCKYTDTCFGVTVPWWDDIFKTIPKEPNITQRIIDFYFNDDENKPIQLTETANCQPKMHSCQPTRGQKADCMQFRNCL